MSEKRFTIVSRGGSTAIFHPEEELIIKNFPSFAGPITAAFRTRWNNLGEEIQLPGNIWVEATGLGVSLDSVLPAFATAAAGILPVIAFCSNAAILEPEIELGFECTRGEEEREFFQSFHPEETSTLYAYRFVKPGATTDFLSVLGTHPELDRLMRAINQYRFGLEFWRMGREFHSVAHFWMAAEALTKAFIRRELDVNQLDDPINLAEILGVELKTLDSTVRRKFVFHDDDETYRKAKRSSDGFEHGFLTPPELHSLAKPIRNSAATHVRKAIFELMDLPTETVSVLEDLTPRGYWPIAKYIRGTILSNSDTIAKEGSRYPFLRWSSGIRKAQIDEDGTLRITPNETVVPELAKGAKISIRSYEAWQPD